MHQMQICSWICSLKPYSNAMAQSSSCSAPWYFLPDKPGLLENTRHQQKKIQISVEETNLGGRSLLDPFLHHRDDAQLPPALRSSAPGARGLVLGRGRWQMLPLLSSCRAKFPPGVVSGPRRILHAGGAAVLP